MLAKAFQLRTNEMTEITSSGVKNCYIAATMFASSTRNAIAVNIFHVYSIHKTWVEIIHQHTYLIQPPTHPLNAHPKRPGGDNKKRRKQLTNE